jgi:uncharacterized protein YciU (UPF0263 family)
MMSNNLLPNRRQTILACPPNEDTIADIHQASSSGLYRFFPYYIGAIMPDALSPEQLIELGYELFLENAADHLPPEDIVDITLEFEDRGAVESCPPGQEWIALRGPFDVSQWIEIWIGLLDHQDEFSVIFAKLLLPISGERSQAVFNWKPVN